MIGREKRSKTFLNTHSFLQQCYRQYCSAFGFAFCLQAITVWAIFYYKLILLINYALCFGLLNFFCCFKIPTDKVFKNNDCSWIPNQWCLRFLHQLVSCFQQHCTRAKKIDDSCFICIQWKVHVSLLAILSCLCPFTLVRKLFLLTFYRCNWWSLSESYNYSILE